MPRALISLFRFWGFIILVSSSFLISPSLQAQESDLVELKYPKVDPNELLDLYERLTDKIIIRDANLAVPQPLNVVVSRPIPKADAIRLIESVLLLNGFAIVKVNEQSVKVVNTAGKNPRSQGLPLFANIQDLPQEEQVAAFFLPLRFINATEALPLFQQHVQLNPTFGNIIAAPNANALIITENVAVIRQLIKLKQMVDIPPEKWGKEMDRPLKYATVANIFPALVSLLKESKEGIDSSAGGGANTASAATGGSGSAGGTADRLSAPTEDNTPLVALVGRTKIVADKRSNSILAFGSSEILDQIEIILSKLDRRQLQVYLSCVIGQLSMDDSRETSIDLLQKFARLDQGGVASSSRTRTGSADLTLNPRSLTSTSAFTTLPAGFTLYGAIGSALDAYVKLLEGSNRFKVLSRPFVYAANNKKATISSGTEVPVPTSTLSSLNSGSSSTNNVASVSSSIDYKEVLLKLEVIPIISPEKEVTLQIVQTNNSIQGSTVISGNTIPNVNKQEVNTTITVPDRTTVVLGGLMTESDEITETGFPILKDIPGLGYLFKGKTTTKRKTELVLLIQPTVIENNNDLQQATSQEKENLTIGDETFKFKRPPSTSTENSKKGAPTPYSKPLPPFSLGKTENISNEKSYKLRFPIHYNTPTNPINPAEISVKLLFYDQKPNGKIEQSPGEAQVMFENNSPTWKSEKEFLIAEYPLQKRKTPYGYHLQVSYQGVLQIDHHSSEKFKNEFINQKE